MVRYKRKQDIQLTWNRYKLFYNTKSLSVNMLLQFVSFDTIFFQVNKFNLRSACRVYAIRRHINKRELRHDIFIFQ